MRAFESSIVDFPKDIAAAIEQWALWVWSESCDGKTARLEKDAARPDIARAEARAKDGSLMLAATWSLDGGRARLVSLEGKLASACSVEKESEEQAALSVFSAASLGCSKFSGPSLAARAAARIEKIWRGV